ncbi:hypothetical protein Nepgr_019438 [Nepenthes gracilis]|uniref:LOB domain-containing protein n=1 Tax=Nepenthes gracilis TaxID=150966 RepID=A0AAD3SVX6_NEPGR|nr:hypothetical protein Nepgr_019438 [Nepenthes gracilis]
MSGSHRMSSSSQIQACAACKYQRRKCVPDCILAPYFPPDHPKQFLNAHKLFGVSNITKIICNLSPPERDIAMRTIIYHSDARANDPVGGCYRIICDLQLQIEYYKAELELVLHQLAICKSQESAAAAAAVNYCNNDNEDDSGGGGTVGGDVSHADDRLVLHACGYDNDGGYQRLVLQHPAAQSSPSLDHQRYGDVTEVDPTARDLAYDCLAMQGSSALDDQSHVCGEPGFERDCCQDVKPLVDMLSIFGREYVEFDDHLQADPPCERDDQITYDDPQQTTERSEEFMSKGDKVVLEEDDKPSSDHGQTSGQVLTISDS